MDVLIRSCDRKSAQSQFPTRLNSDVASQLDIYFSIILIRIIFFKPVISKKCPSRSLHIMIIMIGWRHFTVVNSSRRRQQFEQEVHQNSLVKLVGYSQIQTSGINNSFNKRLKMSASVSTGLS